MWCLMFVVCMLFVRFVCCSFVLVSCVLFLVCCLMFVVCGVLFVVSVCCWLFVVCRLAGRVYQRSLVGYCVLCVVC